MKKILLITAMFMAMNTWSAQYKVCYAFDTGNLEYCVNRFIGMGFEPLGSIVIQPPSTGAGSYLQAMYKK